MAVKIKKLKHLGQVIYPATILDAVKDPVEKITVGDTQVTNPNYNKTLREILSSQGGNVGDLTTLTTDVKTDAVSAINEIDANADSKVVTVVKQDTAEDGYASTYVIKQGKSGEETQVGVKINIPKDFLLQDASIKTATADNATTVGVAAGKKYLDFLVNTENSDTGSKHLYISLDDLVAVISALENAAQVQLAISSDNVISATIVAKSVTNTELSDDVNASLELADSSIQSVAVTSADENLITSTSKGTDDAHVSYELAIKTSSIEDGATGVAKAVDVYTFALTCVDATDTNDYTDVF